MNPHHAIEGGLAIIVIGALSKIVPPLAGLFALAYYGAQLWQSELGKAWRARWRRLFMREPLSFMDRLSFALAAMAVPGALAALYFVGSIAQ